MGREHNGAVSGWRQLTEAQRAAWATEIAGRVVVDRASRAIEVKGPCSTCGHDFAVVLTDRDMLEEAARTRGVTAEELPVDALDWAGVLRFLATCHCEEAHLGRPAMIAHGCGASGWLIDTPGD